jgi:hypothetical protein
MRSGKQLREKGTKFTASRPVGPSVVCLFQKAVKPEGRQADAFPKRYASRRHQEERSKE